MTQTKSQLRTEGLNLLRDGLTNTDHLRALLLLAALDLRDGRQSSAEGIRKMVDDLISGLTPLGIASAAHMTRTGAWIYCRKAVYGNLV